MSEQTVETGYTALRLRRLICAVRGHVPDGLVVLADDPLGIGGEMRCIRCGSAVPCDAL